CRGIVNGYTSSPPCAVVPYFLPGNPVTRGQVSKMISNAASFTDVIPTTRQTFTDVPLSNPFWLYIERLVQHGAISGYDTSPPCTSGIPCFLLTNNSTRGEPAKIVANTFYPGCQTPARPDSGSQ